MMTTIDGQQILQTSRTPNLAGSTLALFLTFDGRWYRVRTRLETLGKYKLKGRAEALFAESAVPA